MIVPSTLARYNTRFQQIVGKNLNQYENPGIRGHVRPHSEES